MHALLDPDAHRMNELAHVEGTLLFLKPSEGRPQIQVPPMGQGRPTMMAREAYDSRTIPVYDVRPRASELSLDREGFVIAEHVSQVSDYYDDSHVVDVYYPEVIELVKRTTGASDVMIFDHTIRALSVETQKQRKVRAAVVIVHGDYTDASGPTRIQDLMGAEEAARRLQSRVAFYNVWRPINGTVESKPLALLDATTLDAASLVETDLLYGDRTGTIYQQAYAAAQRWCFFASHRQDEATIFKSYDTRTDGTTRFVTHGGFDDATTKPGARSRVSIEIRTIAFFDGAAPDAA